MNSRLLLLVAVLLFCCSQAALDVKVEEQNTQVVKGNNRRLLTYIDCGKLCSVRCGAHGRPNVCLRACGTCCQRCKCVPPGTSGNREVCGKCYSEMTTHGGKKKCP